MATSDSRILLCHDYAMVTIVTPRFRSCSTVRSGVDERVSQENLPLFARSLLLMWSVERLGIVRSGVRSSVKMSPREIVLSEGSEVSGRRLVMGERQRERCSRLVSRSIPSSDERGLEVRSNDVRDDSEKMALLFVSSTLPLNMLSEESFGRVESTEKSCICDASPMNRRSIDG